MMNVFLILISFNLLLPTTSAATTQLPPPPAPPQLFPRALSFPRQYLENAHLTKLRSIIQESLSLEDAVVALLEKYTKGAERVVKSAQKLQQQDNIPASCKQRVLKHLNNRLELQTDKSDAAVAIIHNTFSGSTSPTAEALQHLNSFAATISTHADAIETCLDRCDAATATLFGGAGSSGGAVAKIGAKINCQLETNKLRVQMQKSTARTRRAILASTSSLSEVNGEIGGSLTGSSAKNARDAEQKRNNDLTDYLTVRTQHDAYAKELTVLLKQRTEILEGSRLARDTSQAAIRQLRTTCEMVKKKRIALLNATNQTSTKFLTTLHDQLKVYEEIVKKEKGKNDAEEEYTMSLSAQVDATAARCMKSMETLTSRIVTQKRIERRPVGKVLQFCFLFLGFFSSHFFIGASVSTGDDAAAIASVMRGKTTKKDGPDSNDVNEQGAKWAQHVYSTERIRKWF